MRYKYSGTENQDFYIWRMPEHGEAIQLNLAPSRQEVRHRNINVTSGNFSKKTLRVDTSTQISKKRQTQALLPILQSGTLPDIVSITHTYNCSREWLCDYDWNSSASRRQLSTILPHGGLKMQLVGVTRLRTVGQNQIRAVNTVDSIQWKFGVSNITKHLKQHHQTLGAHA